MKTKQLVVRSAVTVVATGLTLLSSANSQASGRGPSGARMGGSHGSMNNGAIHQGISNRAMSRGHGNNDAIGRIGNSKRSLTGARDDRGGRGERERRHGKDDGVGHVTRVTRGEREAGDDHGGRGERERGDDHGGRGERERGDDHGGGR